MYASTIHIKKNEKKNLSSKLRIKLLEKPVNI